MMQVLENEKVRQWVVLGTGGTIAGTASHAGDHTGYRAGQVGVGQLLESVPGLEAVLQGDGLLWEQVAQLDSKDMDHDTWQVLARRCRHWLAQPQVAGLVITHGTDTLEETAWFLQQVVHTGQPVVMTCAMRPATALSPDGPQNLLDAFCVARDPLLQSQSASDVMVVCAGRIHSARDVQKVHPYRLDAFSSGDASPLGWVEQGVVRWARGMGSFRPSTPHPHAEQALAVSATQWPWVEVLTSHAGADARRVHALVAAGVRGMVVAGTGNATVHQALLAALLQAQQDHGVAVRLTSRCPLGQCVGSAMALPMADQGLGACKARIDLMLDLLA